LTTNSGLLLERKRHDRVLPKSPENRAARSRNLNPMNNADLGQMRKFRKTLPLCSLPSPPYGRVLADVGKLSKQEDWRRAVLVRSSTNGRIRPVPPLVKETLTAAFAPPRCRWQIVPVMAEHSSWKMTQRYAEI
jgi:hypothetical protein